ncbi:hypothetical protein F511_34392 [Dorcoceras hygrometricum]|uniref:Uncharacterized protein n=1 Tax=Dorcoceras hygrometricum TaxID=472368 RepID=A0A2Z7BJ89_9LAMI|nr:hypothetical protein F511_34392 [Dorcoceras hygrometricum]
MVYPPRPEAGEPWLPEPEELPNIPWYEEKYSNLKIPDIATIKEKGGTMGEPELPQGMDEQVLLHQVRRYEGPVEMRNVLEGQRFYLSLRTPDLAPNLAPFLEAMRGKSYNAPELIKEDLLCFFKFSRKGVEFVGDLVGPPKKTTKKRKAPSLAEKEAHREKRKKEGASTSGAQKEETSRKSQAPTPPMPTSEEIPDLPPVTTIAEEASSGKGPRRIPPFDPSKDSLVDSPSGLVATRYICNMAPDRDLQVLKRADDAEAAERASEKEARAIEREALVAELEKANAWAVQEAERLKSEAKEEFLRSPEFDVLLAKRAWGYFKDGFWGCLAQFRANGYPEEEHPTSFLDVQQALAEVGDEEEAEEEEGDEEEKEEGDEEEKEEGEGGYGADVNPSNSPQP